ncbi:hypothetical protein QBC46DRAFT_123110 [Diplogelasinospora grovesii]|uniref:RRM domain-containing protein n=1 Tax=Diplogelasinospora grovesii TaxID=303347 RepID=A0AAN6N7H2_9PEZI|nr:hypothetical protein QBC46DRAFT_123110 [Diplogelasinospora grovesii]
MDGDQNVSGATGANGTISASGATRATPTIPGASASSFADLTSASRESSFPTSIPTSMGAAKNPMGASGFLSSAQQQQQLLRPVGAGQSAFALSNAPVNTFERDATRSLGAAFPVDPVAPSALIRNLPINTSEETLRLMMVFSKELVSVELLPVEQSEDAGFRSALLKFKTMAGAQETKMMLDGKSNISNDANMIVEIMGGSSTTADISKVFAIDTAVSTGGSTAASSATSSATPSRQPSRFNATFQSLGKITPPVNGMYSPSGELASQDSSAHFQSIFLPQSTIGNHLAERTRKTSKALINKYNNDAGDDDETGQLLNDPLAYAETGLGGLSVQQRRATAPQLPITRMASLSLNTAPSVSAMAMPAYPSHGMGNLAAHAHATLSPTMTSVSNAGMGYHSPAYRSPAFPPANPADQNPPCNTLYVGNLPLDTSEEELKAMFSKQRGYKRLCFRTKQNGPMCFVEFEDVSFATKALHELYGYPLHNSVKGGIRLSFSKNPLGVRSGPTPLNHNLAGSIAAMNGMHSASGNAFTTASGPPPGLSLPPGLGTIRGGYSAGYSASPSLMAGGGNPYASSGFAASPSGVWASYPSHTSMASTTSSFPPHMMGR